MPRHEWKMARDQAGRTLFASEIVEVASLFEIVVSCLRSATIGDGAVLRCTESVL